MSKDVVSVSVDDLTNLRHDLVNIQTYIHSMKIFAVMPLIDKIVLSVLDMPKPEPEPEPEKVEEVDEQDKTLCKCKVDAYL